MCICEKCGDELSQVFRAYHPGQTTIRDRWTYYTWTGDPSQRGNKSQYEDTSIGSPFCETCEPEQGDRFVSAACITK